MLKPIHIPNSAWYLEQNSIISKIINTKTHKKFK